MFIARLTVFLIMRQSSGPKPTVNRSSNVICYGEKVMVNFEGQLCVDFRSIDSGGRQGDLALYHLASTRVHSLSLSLSLYLSLSQHTYIRVRIFVRDKNDLSF